MARCGQPGQRLGGRSGKAWPKICSGTMGDGGSIGLPEKPGDHLPHQARVVFVEPGKEAGPLPRMVTVRPRAWATALSASSRYGSSSSTTRTFFRRQKIADERLGQGVGESQLEQPDLIGQAQFPDRIGHIGAAHPAGDDAPDPVAADPVEGGGLGQGPGLVLGGQQPDVGQPGHRRHHHLLKGVLLKPAWPRPGSQVPQGHRPPGVVHPGGGAQQHRHAQFFREGKGRLRHLLGFPGVAGSSMGRPAILA